MKLVGEKVSFENVCNIMLVPYKLRGVSTKYAINDDVMVSSLVVPWSLGVLKLKV